jgi:transcriptional regulator with XRE-family HTH domain
MLPEESQVDDLKKLRGMADWTQTRTARASGVNRTKLSQAECGEVELSPEEDAAVRRALLAAIRKRATRMENLLASTTEVQQNAVAASA